MDVEHRSDGWPLVGLIVMVDAFDAENGATRFVPGSHHLSREPSEVLASPIADREEQLLMCDAAGSMIVFDASVRHGHTANVAPRRQTARMRPETFRRIGELAKYVLDVSRS